MQRNHLFGCALLLCSLNACAFPLNGDWEGIERHILVMGEVANKIAIPYEECFPNLNANDEHTDESTTCVHRGFSMVVNSPDNIIFEATNDLTTGQQVVLSSKSLSSDVFMLTDGHSFETECIVHKEDREQYLYCDFTNSIGYLGSSKMVFQRIQEAD